MLVFQFYLRSHVRTQGRRQWRGEERYNRRRHIPMHPLSQAIPQLPKRPQAHTIQTSHSGVRGHVFTAGTSPACFNGPSLLLLLHPLQHLPALPLPPSTPSAPPPLRNRRGREDSPHPPSSSPLRRWRPRPLPSPRLPPRWCTSRGPGASSR